MRLKIIAASCFCLLSPLHAQSADLITWDDLTLVGGYRVPAVTLGGQGNQTASSIDKLPGSSKWIMGHSSGSGYIVEFTEPGEPSMSFPLLTTGRSAQVLTNNANHTWRGAQWIDANTVICSARVSYSYPVDWNWISTYNLSTSTETLLEVGHIDETSAWAEGYSWNQLFHTVQAVGSGFVRVPSSWLSANAPSGWAIGLASGGYDVLGSPFGPALGLLNINDTEPLIYIDYPNSTHSSDSVDHFEIRDKNYSLPAYKDGDPNSSLCPSGSSFAACDNPKTLYSKHPDFGLLSSDPNIGGPTGAVGYFGADEVSHGAGWIDDTSFKGVVYGVTSPNGYLDYDAQGAEGGAGNMFLVLDPSSFYDDSGSHYTHPSEYSGGPAGYYSHKLYVYDPDCIAQSAAGTIDEWECAPSIITPDFSGLPYTPVSGSKPETRITGVTWDDDRGYLWIMLTYMHDSNQYPIMVAYLLNGSPKSRAPRIGSSFSGQVR